MRREEVGRVKAILMEAERSGQMVLRCQEVGFSYDEAPVVRELTTTILRGDRELTRMLMENGSVDLSYAIPQKTRFRVNV